MAKPTNPPTCLQCTEPPVLGGLCEAHHHQERQRQSDARAATEALETYLLEGKPFLAPGLSSELMDASKWWHRAALALQAQALDSVLGGETEAAQYWCNNIAAGIVEEERCYRNGAAPDEKKLGLRAQSWLRLKRYTERG